MSEAGPARPRVGVVGHVEWIQFAVTERVPAVGEITGATQAFELAAGGGAVAAVQLARLAGGAAFHTVVGDDALGPRACAELAGHGLDLHAATRPGARTRRGVTHLTADHERTITILDPRLVPHGDDPLPWERIAGLDAVYVTGGDAGALRAARAARVLVATARAGTVLRESGVAVDVLVGSAGDPGEPLDQLAAELAPGLVVRTRGAAGGDWTAADGRAGAWRAAPLPGPPVDSYGCGDAFAAGLTYALGAGWAVPEAVALGARCGAACLTGRGPYAALLSDPG
ncbi:MAG: PfkB family carbohydrate kinase [Solirubrobacteraceae bacterium]|nr:PfkB family carbohydrate kinase [Solirubrobacteraceae bacterium]